MLNLIFLYPTGVYNSSKAAETFLSETLRIEMEPLGVRVVTAMVGEIETNIYQNCEPPILPPGSYYKSVEQYIIDQAAGKLQKQNEPLEITARNLLRDVLSGRSGQTWRGGVAGTAKLATWLLPTRLFVSLLLYALDDLQSSLPIHRVLGVDHAFQSRRVQDNPSTVYSSLNLESTNLQFVSWKEVGSKGMSKWHSINTPPLRKSIQLRRKLLVLVNEVDLTM